MFGTDMLQALVAMGLVGAFVANFVTARRNGLTASERAALVAQGQTIQALNSGLAEVRAELAASEAAQAAQEKRHAAEIAAAETKYKAEIAAAETRHKAEVATRDERIATLEQRVRDLEQQIERRKATPPAQVEQHTITTVERVETQSIPSQVEKRVTPPPEPGSGT